VVATAWACGPRDSPFAHRKNPQTKFSKPWLFLTSYGKLRAELLKKFKWDITAKLGPRAFETIGGEVVNVVLIGFTGSLPSSEHVLTGLDAGEKKTPSEKAVFIQDHPFVRLKQKDQLRNPDARLVLSDLGKISLLESVAEASHGQGSFDSPRFSVAFWEVSGIRDGWVAQQSTPSIIQDYGGCHFLFRWENGTGGLAKMMDAKKKEGYSSGKWRAGIQEWGKLGILAGQMGELPCTLYLGQSFDENASVIIPHQPSHLPALWAFCASDDFRLALKEIDQSIKITCKTLVKVPFDLLHWQKVAAEKYPAGLPKPFSSDPTQWLFSGHPAGADHPLQVAVARLVGYLWPRQTGSSFPDCPALDPDGLESLADDDGIVCLSPARGEAAAADRLRSLLASAFGDEWSSAKERELLLETAVACDTMKAAANLGDWLRQDFFIEHCKLFQSRPFVWQLWDGNPHGFTALVNYHKLAAPNGKGRKMLELLAYTYLGDWIDRQKLDQAEGVNGADDRLAAALDLQSQVKKILDGEPPYDIFVRWKPLHKQAIGWDPDINDGIRLNIRPFLNAQLRKGGKAGAGILRAKPGTIKWSKDRGKEPMRSKEEFPWFWGWDENDHALANDFGAPIPGSPPAGDSFDGNRWNDLHYTRAAKEAARARHRGEG